MRGVASGGVINENYLSQFNIPQKIKEGRGKKELKTILDDTHGCVKPGEMLLALGRPGAGCTTLLKMLSNRRNGYAEVQGDVRWGGMDPKEAVQYCGQIVMNTEEELFFPTLTVGEVRGIRFLPVKQGSVEWRRRTYEAKSTEEGTRVFASKCQPLALQRLIASWLGGQI